MKLLELFKGTGSVSKALNPEYCISIDIESKFNPDICMDIMDWDYTTYPVGYFDLIWASPPCTYYSSMYNIQKKDITRELKHSDSIVRRVLDIISYFKPEQWIIENPWSGKLKHRDFMQGLPFTDGDYCKYGYPYRKRTRFWTNKPIPLSKCTKNDHCQFSDGQRHLSTIGAHRKGSGNAYKCTIGDLCKSLGLKYNLELKYSIPADLIRQLVKTENNITI